MRDVARLREIADEREIDLQPHWNAGEIVLEGGRRVGYDFVHSAVDDHSRLAYVELPGLVENLASLPISVLPPR